MIKQTLSTPVVVNSSVDFSREPTDFTREIRASILHGPVDPRADTPSTRTVRAIADGSASSSLGGNQTAPRPRLTIEAEELRRLQRLVHLAALTIAELSLWVANAGRDVVEFKE